MNKKARKPFEPNRPAVEQAPLLRLADVIDTVSKLAVDSREAARVVNHMLRARHISFASDFDARTLH